MSTIDTSTWSPDADLNGSIEGIPLNADASIAQTWQAIRILMAAMKGDTDALETLVGGKATDSDVVHLAGAETVSGEKTFSASIHGTSFFNAGLEGATSLGDSSVGGFFTAIGKSHASLPGVFRAVAQAGGGWMQLIGKPDGTLTWNGQAIQTSSDERLKTSLSPVPDDVLDAWGEVQWGQFQYLDAVERKGESARLHLGLIAQRVKAVFEERNLDACEYGILCYEEEEDLWTVRYTEALAMEAVFQRRRADRLEARVAALEEAMK